MQRVALLGSHLSKLAHSKHTTNNGKSVKSITMGDIKSDIHLYTGQTPNGIKVSMLLEELGLQYKVPPPTQTWRPQRMLTGADHGHRHPEEHPEGEGRNDPGLKVHPSLISLQRSHGSSRSTPMDAFPR